MTKPSSLQFAFLRFSIPLLLLATFFAIATTQVSGNEVKAEGGHVNEELAKTKPQGHEEEQKFKGAFHPKPVFKKYIPIVKPIPKPIPIVKPIHKPIPVYKPIPKPVPVHKPIPKPIPAVEQEPFFFKKPFFKFPFVQPIIHKTPAP